jgi:hypothetical protein
MWWIPSRIEPSVPANERSVGKQDTSIASSDAAETESKNGARRMATRRQGMIVPRTTHPTLR